ncbi:MAG: hypothetical protein MZV70_54455 [Desulfobacterales bacterium]|nr:hypothetical protein [Desulfobacterales bacterium]
MFPEPRAVDRSYTKSNLVVLSPSAFCPRSGAWYSEPPIAAIGVGELPLESGHYTTIQIDDLGRYARAAEVRAGPRRGVGKWFDNVHGSCWYSPTTKIATPPRESGSSARSLVPGRLPVLRPGEAPRTTRRCVTPCRQLVRALSDVPEPAGTSRTPTWQTEVSLAGPGDRSPPSTTSRCWPTQRRSSSTGLSA